MYTIDNKLITYKRTMDFVHHSWKKNIKLFFIFFTKEQGTVQIQQEYLTLFLYLI